MTGDQFRADVVVPVHGGLHHVRHCLRALAEHTAGARVVVVDDASTTYEGRRLEELVRDLDGDPRFELLRNRENLGYLRSVNRGIAHGTAPRVVTLNSDVIVTPGWLDGLIAALEDDARNAIASPLSNHANLTRIDFPWGTHHLEVAEAVRVLSPASYPEIGIASGFCLIIRRTHLTELGGFDEVYDPGYYEESDLCMRAMERGLRVVADDATFVFHHGWASFGPEQRTALMERNAVVFERRWGAGAHSSWQQRVRTERPFVELEYALRRSIGGGAAVDGAGPRWTIERERGRTGGVLPHPRLDPLPPNLHEISVERRRGRGSILVLLPAIDADTASASLLRLASELVLRGRDVHVATAGPVNVAAFADPVVLRPSVYRDTEELLEQEPAHDLVIATSSGTLSIALALAERDGCRVASLLGEVAGRPVPIGPDTSSWMVADALTRIDHHLVRAATEWSPPAHIGTHHHVPYGVDHDVFHPTTDSTESPHVVVVASAHTRLAEWQTVVDALEVVRERLPGVRLTIHGAARAPLPFEAQVRGHLTLTEEADLLRDASVVVDASASAPSLRSRLRTLSVGVPLVVLRGHDPSGVTLPGQNCLEITPGDHDELARTVLDAIKDPMRGNKLVVAGLATAHAFGLDRELANIERVLDRVLGSAVASAEPPGAGPVWDRRHSELDPAALHGLELVQDIALKRRARDHELESALGSARAAEQRLEEVYASETWRTGRALLRLPLLLRRLLRGRGGRRG